MELHPYLAHHREIEAAIAATLRPCRMSWADAEDFAGYARLQLIDDDCRILRAFSGRGSRQAYLKVAVGRLLLDYRVKEWGKWRPTVAARRLGPAAIAFERLVHRDGYTSAEAHAVLAAAGVLLSEDVASTLTRRHRRRRFVSLALVEGMPSPAPRPDEQWESSERQTCACRVAEALRAAVSGLTADERTLLTHRFSPGRTIVALARASGQRPSVLYRRSDAVLRRLRRALAESGIDGAFVRPLLADAAIEFPALSDAWAA